MSRPRPFILALAERAVALALRAYSPGHRTRFGPGMLELFRDTARDAAADRRRLELLGITGRTIADILLDAIRCRRPGGAAAAVEFTASAARRSRAAGLASFWQDGRHAVRGWRRRPWRFAAAAGMLGLAVGLTTAMFTIVDSLLLRPVPFRDPDQLARVDVGPSPPASVFAAWRRSHAFAGIEGAVSDAAVVSTGAGDLLRNVARVTPGVFEFLGGVRPLRGRLFDAADGLPGRDDRVLISESVWQQVYGRSPSAVGSRLVIDGRPVVVVGVLPSEFRFPDWDTEIWQAAAFGAPPDLSDDVRIPTYVRFAPGIPREDALRVAAAEAQAVDPAATGGREARAWPLVRLTIDSYYERAVPLLAGGVVLLFLILCMNVGTLLLDGLGARTRELATRAALGASRARLVRLVLIESTIVGLFGLGLGAALAWFLVSVARSILPEAALLHSLNPMNLDRRALGVTALAGLAAASAAGVLPALLGTRLHVGRWLQSGGRSGTDTPRTRTTAKVLLAGQVALSCTLLLGAAFLVRSFINLATADRGIDTSNVLVAWMGLTHESLGTPEARAAAASAIEEQARALPGVTHTAWSYGTPPQGAIGLAGEWTPDSQPPVSLTINQSIVSGDFFALYGIPILRGRSFEPSDPSEAVVLSERLARALWPDDDPIGQTVSLDNENQRPRRPRTYQVVGVARDTHFPTLDIGKDVPQIYTRYDEAIFTPMLSLRCTGRCPEPGLVTRRLTEAFPHVRVQRLHLLESVYFAQFARPRAAAGLAFAFAVTGILAAAAGLFGLLSHDVASRRREFGIRSALGATSTEISRLVWRDGLAVSLAGIGFGLIGGLSLTRVLTSLLFEVTMTDPVSWSVVVATLAATIGAATWHPTRSAARTSPVELLREE